MGKLRFKDENNDYPNVKSIFLGKIAVIKTGDLNVQDSSDNGIYPFYDRSIDIKRLDVFSYDKEAIIYPGEGSEFYPRLYRGKFALHQRAYAIFDFNKDVQLDFVYQYLKTKNNHFLTTAVGSTVKSLRMECFEKCEIKLPSIKEQEKIGGFLSTFDKLIEKQHEKIGLLKELKKGYLQKMFPKNDATVPEIRFKGYTDAWEQYKLSELYDFSKGKGLSLDSFYDGKDSPGIAYGHLYTKYSEVINNVKISSNDGSGVLSKKGDLLFPGSSTVPFGTAQSNALMLDGVKLGGDVIIARAKDLSTYAPFISYQINAKKSKLYPITVGTTITHMYGKDLANIVYNFPKFKEQTKIGRTLESLDFLITLHQRKLDQLENLKKGYMQRLFA
jgi:restriction endonuclease S subunit